MLALLESLWIGAVRIVVPVTSLEGEVGRGRSYSCHVRGLGGGVDIVVAGVRLEVVSCCACCGDS